MSSSLGSFFPALAAALCCAVCLCANVQAAPARASVEQMAAPAPASSQPKPSRPKVAAYFEAGPYWEFTLLQKEIIKALRQRGVADRITLPDELYISPGWDASESVYRAEARKLMQNPDIDVIISMTRMLLVIIGTSQLLYACGTLVLFDTFVKQAVRTKADILAEGTGRDFEYLIHKGVDIASLRGKDQALEQLLAANSELAGAQLLTPEGKSVASAGHVPDPALTVEKSLSTYWPSRFRQKQEVLRLQLAVQPQAITTRISALALDLGASLLISFLLLLELSKLLGLIAQRNLPPDAAANALGSSHHSLAVQALRAAGFVFFLGYDMSGGAMGFGAKVRASKEMPLGELLDKVHPQDLVKFGLIPEFVGRIPIITHVDELDEPDLVRILTEPKNALVRQYQKLFELENVDLRFTPNALKAIAAKAIERKTGARGLRNVMERTMLDIMFKLPSLPNVRECLINQAVIDKGKEPVLLFGDKAENADTSKAQAGGDKAS